MTTLMLQINYYVASLRNCRVYPHQLWVRIYLAGYAYYQVLHTGTDHWVTIKAISDHKVYMYDSLFLQPTYHTLKQIAAILQIKSPKIQVHLEKVQMQSNSIDCGVYAVAF